MKAGRAWQLLSFRNAEDAIDDSAQELSAILGVPLPAARSMVDAVLDNYHFKRAPFPQGMDRSIWHFIVHLTQPFRIPVMTGRMDWVLDGLASVGARSGASALDYGGGGGKDTIILGKSGYRMTFSDFIGPLMPYVAKRFELRGLDVPVVDSRDLGERRFDIINCLDVIEHVYDVEFVTADIIARLNPGALFVCWPAFFNSWNGDHIEKNCGYRSYYIQMLERVGLKLLGQANGAQLYRRERAASTSFETERSTVRHELYRLSLDLSTKAAKASVLRLPKRAISVALGRSKSFDVEIDDIIDNLAIRRLSRHQLKEVYGSDV